MNLRSLLPLRPHLGGVLRFPVGQPDDPVLVMLPPHLEAIPVRSVAGSVDRHTQLDRRFRPLGGGSPRLDAIRRAMIAGAILPPIEVYRLHGLCYVIDGHHRVAAALEVGQLYLDAQIIECLPRTDQPENLLEEARLRFALNTGLRQVTFSEPARYDLALAQVHEHRWYMGERGQLVDLRVAAHDWYEHIYQPVLRQLPVTRAADLRSDIQAGDLYMRICDLKYDLSRKRGHDVGFVQAIRAWSAERRPRTRVGTLGRLLGLAVLAYSGVPVWPAPGNPG